MTVLTRYLLRAHLGPFLFAFMALTGVILINTLARQLAQLAGKGLPLDVVMQFFVLSLPSNIALTLPMAVLVSVLYTFSQLSADNEIMALKASGVDLRRLMLPLIVLASLITVGMVWFNDRVLPESNHEWRELMVDIGRKSPLFTLREQTINSIRTGDGMSRYYLRAGRISPNSNRMQDVTIYDISNPRVGRTIYADSGRMAFNQSRTDLYLTLYSGHVREVNLNEPETFQRVGFGQQVMKMEGVGNELERQTSSDFRGDREMSIAMMDGRIDTLRTELGNVAETIAATPPSAGTVRSVAERRNALRRQIREMQVEIQKKLSIAAATLVFVLLGAPLALRFPQGGVGMVIAISLGVFALYYVGLIGGESLADRGYVSPIAAMWASNVVFAIVGLIGLVFMGREQGANRGGDRWRWLRFGRSRRTASAR